MLHFQLDILVPAREQADVGSQCHLPRIPRTTSDGVHEEPYIPQA